MSEDKNIKVARLIGLEKKAREARNEDELYFVVANETRQIIDYVSSFLLLKTPTDRFNIKATSDLATVDRTSPLLTFIENFINNDKTIDTKEIQTLDVEKLAKNIKQTKNVMYKAMYQRSSKEGPGRMEIMCRIDRGRAPK